MESILETKEDVEEASYQIITSFDFIEDNLQTQKKELYESLVNAYNDIYSNYSSKTVKKGFVFASSLKSRFFAGKEIFRLYLIIEDIVRAKFFTANDYEGNSIDTWFEENGMEAIVRLHEYRTYINRL